MKNLGQMMKQAQAMQAKMAEVQESLGAVEISGSAGGGLVGVTLTGKGEMRGMKIDPSLLDANEVEVLEDLITAAFNDAKTKGEAHASERKAESTGGHKMPAGKNMPC